MFYGNDLLPPLCKLLLEVLFPFFPLSDINISEFVREWYSYGV
jgi:hypothetical protein